MKLAQWSVRVMRYRYDVKGILGAFESFYAKLYTKSNNDALKQDAILSATENRAKREIEISSFFQKRAATGFSG